MRRTKSAFFLSCLVVVAAACSQGCSRKPEIWVGPVQVPVRELEQLPPGGMSMSFEDGKKRITFVDLDGHTASALIEPNKTEAEQRAAEEDLRGAATDLKSAMERVKGGWMARETISTRVVPRDGNGWQAGVYQFAPDAEKVKR
jgi:hypothetical protein